MSIVTVWSNKLNGYEIDDGECEGLRVRQLNFLIGPNNSGKSRLLRALCASGLGELSVALDLEVEKYGEHFAWFINYFESCPAMYNLDVKQLLGILKGRSLTLDQAGAVIQDLASTVSNARNRSYNLTGGGSEVHAFYDIREQILRSAALADAVSEAVNAIGSEISQLKQRKRYYIPILRGMRPLDKNTDLYYQRTKKDYFPEIKGGDLNVITGFDLYELLVKFLLGQPDNRERIKEYERILGHEFFGGAEITLIPEYGKDTVSVKIGSDNQFSIYDLGDGMQQVIIITSAAFLEAQDSFFYIEEPEICLHPGLLRKLALFLMNHTKHQYFATTHSNHLLDLAEVDSRVVVHKVAKLGVRDSAVFAVRESTRDRELLAELGVLASSVYLPNSTIWVEGVTDRLYLGVYLKKYVDEIEDGSEKAILEGLLENYHYTFVEYQGGTLGHWSFGEVMDGRLQAARLCSSAFLIADGDITGKGKRAEALRDQLGMSLYVLACKEIENLIPREILIRTSKKIFDSMRADMTVGLSSGMLDSLDQKVESSYFGIGFHLDKALGLVGKGKSVRRVFAEESGTVKNKVKFCMAAVDEMNNSEWTMTTPLREMCAKVFHHILACNEGILVSS